MDQPRFLYMGIVHAPCEMNVEDWHQEFCDGHCKQGICVKHQLTFQSCQSSKEWREPDEMGFSEILIVGDGNCPTCVNEYEDRQFMKLMAEQDKQRRQA